METFRFACDHLVKLCRYYWQPDRLIIIEYFETFIFTLIRHRLDFPYLSEPERKEFNDCLSKWLSVVKEMDDRKLREDEDWPRHQLQTRFIHWACRFESSEILQILLDAGFDPNVVDECGTTPLLLLEQRLYKKTYDNSIADCIELLLGASGIHIDQANDDGFSPLTPLKRLRRSYPNLYPNIYSHLKRVSSLKCVCANVIQLNRIPFERLPRNLVIFVHRPSIFDSFSEVRRFRRNL